MLLLRSLRARTCVPGARGARALGRSPTPAAAPCVPIPASPWVRQCENTSLYTHSMLRTRSERGRRVLGMCEIPNWRTCVCSVFSLLGELCSHDYVVRSFVAWCRGVDNDCPQIQPDVSSLQFGGGSQCPLCLRRDSLLAALIVVWCRVGNTLGLESVCPLCGLFAPTTRC